MQTNLQRDKTCKEHLTLQVVANGSIRGLQSVLSLLTFDDGFHNLLGCVELPNVL